MPPFQPLRRFRPSRNHPGLLTPEATLLVRALARDLLHLRLSTPSTPHHDPSWAGIPQSQPSHLTPPQLTRTLWTLDTGSLRFQLHLPTGAWSIHDRHGLAVFQTAPNGFEISGAQTRLTLILAPREAVFGLGETTGPFNRRGTLRDFRNIDVLGHAPCIHPHLASLYVSIPFALLQRDGRTAGLFWDNPARQRWAIAQPDPDCWTLSADNGPVDLYLFGGPRPADVLARFTELTGRTPLPPRWALGYQQCRYSYQSRAELEKLAAQFRRRDLPCDVLYCDIHHLRGNRVFTFGAAFPKPAEMIHRLAARGFKVVTIVNPGVKDEPSFGVLRRGRRLDAFLKTPDGRRDFRGKAWPGRVRYPDFLRPETRAWWGREQKRLLQLGVAGIWNDMNEPANFAGPDKGIDPACLHRTPSGLRRHDSARNAYGSEMARASREGILAHAPRSRADAPPRPFVVSRAGYAGIQRYAAVWTGDNSSTWEHLADSLQMLLNLGLSGVAFCGADVGGFLGHCTPELLVRWTQAAAFTPFFRNHADLHARPQEPWAFGPDIEALIRPTLHLRYQLLPYLYGLFREAADTGAPVMRPLLWHFPNDPVASAIADQFLLGDRLLVAPVIQQGAVARAVYLPAGEWFDFWTGELHRGGTHIVAPAPLHRIPLYVPAGAILPMTATRPFVGPKEPGTILLHLWPRDEGHLAWYDDDGRTQAFERGECQRRRITTRFHPRGGSLCIGDREGPYRGDTRLWRVLVRGVSKSHRVRRGRSMVAAEYIPELQLLTFTLPAEDRTVDVTWR